MGAQSVSSLGTHSVGSFSGSFAMLSYHFPMSEVEVEVVVVVVAPSIMKLRVATSSSNAR